MPSLGELRIDLIADIAKFVSPFTTATNRMERFARDVARSLEGIERGLQKAGTSLTVRVTAPLAALSAVSIKAADANGNFADSLERLGLQARTALAPLGESLIDAFESIRPAIEDAVRFVNGLAQAFDELDEPTKMAVIRMGAVAAATGPGLVLLAGFAATLKVVSQAIIFTVNNLGVLAKAFAAVEIASASLSIGNAIERNFPETAQYILAGVRLIVTLVTNGWSAIGSTAVRVLDLITGAVLNAIAHWEERFAAFLQVIADNANIVNGILAAISPNLMGIGPAAAGGLAQMLRDTAQTTRENAASYFAPLIAELEKVSDNIAESLTNIDAEMRTSIQNIRRGIAAPSVGPTTLGDALANPLENILESFGANLKHLFPDLDELNKLLARAREIAANVKLPEVVTSRDLTRARELAEEMQKLQQAAERIRQRNDPTRVLRQELAEARRLNALGVLSDEDFLAAAARIKKALDDISDKADETLFDKIGKGIEGFSNRVSDAFADLVVDGRAAFDELGKAFLKMLVQITVQESIFGPLAKSLSAGIGEYFGSGAAATPGAKKALGGAFIGGREVAFAMGGVVSGPTTFPMAGGRTGLMGEAGPEAIMPLQRVNGYLGVRAVGGGTVVNVIDQRRSGERPQLTESTGPDGRKQISILIRDEVKAAIADGSMDRVMGNAFGLGRRGGRR